mgnify:FL=1
MNVSFFGNLNLNNNSIYDLKKISGYLGRWSIDESGKLIAEEVVTKKLEVKNIAEFGTVEKPIGITIYDEVTKEPYCIKVKNGVMVTTMGKCSEQSSANSIDMSSSDISSSTVLTFPDSDISSSTASTAP